MRYPVLSGYIGVYVRNWVNQLASRIVKGTARATGSKEIDPATWRRTRAMRMISNLYYYIREWVT